MSGPIAICMYQIELKISGDIFGTNEETQSDRMAGIWFRIEKGSEAGPGVHDYDESGIVWEGIAILQDFRTVECDD